MGNNSKTLEAVIFDEQIQYQPNLHRKSGFAQKPVTTASFKQVCFCEIYRAKVAKRFSEFAPQCVT